MTVPSTQLVSAFVEVESTIRGRFTRKLCRIGKRFDVDDLLQSTRLKAFAAIDKCYAADDLELRHWILQIAKNAYRTEIDNHIGRGKRSINREVDSVDVLLTRPNLKAVETSEISESCNEVVALLDALPPSQSQAVKAVYLDGREYADIADEMGVTINSVRLLVSRGLKLIRQLTVPYGFELASDGKLVENPAEQNVIGAMRTLRASGWSYSEIAEAATTRCFLARRAQTWTPAKIREILTAS